MPIRLATIEDLDEIMRIYDSARKTMRANGNDKQWINGYPTREMVEEDIAQNMSYVIVDDEGQPHAVFMFSTIEDPAYAHIEDGAWLNDKPYGVIHRIGSDGFITGVLSSAVDYCLKVIDNIRIDTHADNAIMRHVLEKKAFKQCGTIYCHDGSPRVAYQYVA